MLHTTHKFCSLSVGYVFGKATGLLLLMQGDRWAAHPYFRFGRMRGNRFVAQYFATVPILFMHEPLLEFLVTQILRDKQMQRSVRNLWGQLNCRELMIEARAHEALYNWVLEPLMVVLGIDYLPEEEDKTNGIGSDDDESGSTSNDETSEDASMWCLWCKGWGAGIAKCAMAGWSVPPRAIRYYLLARITSYRACYPVTGALQPGNGIGHRQR
jgi:hypothetical protein